MRMTDGQRLFRLKQRYQALNAQHKDTSVIHNEMKQIITRMLRKAVREEKRRAQCH